MARDKDYRRMICSTRWAQLRRQVLSGRPLCARCSDAGRLRLAAEVHHVRPVEEGLTVRDKERLMFDEHNLLPLCHGCHVAIHKEMHSHSHEGAKRRIQDQKAAALQKIWGDPGGGFLRPPGGPPNPAPTSENAREKK